MIILKTIIWFVLGAPVGSFIGGNMFKNMGSIESFKILTVVALITCVVQIIVSQLMELFSKANDKNDSYKKVATNDNLNNGEDNATEAL